MSFTLPRWAAGLAARGARRPTRTAVLSYPASLRPPLAVTGRTSTFERG
jgi:hypothetical protein